MKYSILPERRTCFFDCSSEAGHRLVRSLLGAAGLALLASILLSIVDPASGAERAALRSTVTVASDVVTIGDFFENAGPLADRPLFRSPDLGTTGPVAAVRVIDLARGAGLAEADAGGLVEVSVSRLARPVEAKEIERLIVAEALRRPGRSDEVGVDDLEVAFDTPVEPQMADPRSAEPVRVVSLAVSAQTGRFDALIQIDQGEKSDRLRLRGILTETAPVTVLTRSFTRGETIAADDLRTERQPRARGGAVRAPVDPSEVVGRQARRALRAGQPVVVSDFMRPQVVARGDVVTIVYRTKVLQITGRGQAQQAGAVGDMVPVLNPQTKRTLHGIVAAPGLVEISSPTTSVASLAKVDP